MKAFLVSLPLVLFFDFIWLGFVMKDFNLRHLGPIGRIEDGSFQLLMFPAVVAYLLMALSIALFSVPRAMESGSFLGAFLWGAALGLVVYGIFDMTNLAILKNYSIPFALADMAWGTFLYGAVTAIVREIVKVWV